ncbi:MULTISPECIES: sugar transferase [unclassified Vibrio]|uniref:sugar transferase n=1 Tax=unclassified Vibrio TaxID=2614977 RepID=UPI00354E4B15
MYRIVFKRVFDLVVGLLSLTLFIPIIFFSWLVATIETKSNGFFLQDRVGKDGHTFKVIKIKTMTEKSDFSSRTTVTSALDSRITVSGKLFRKYKIDELPQLINVVIGQMSFVGPRPDVPGYADKLRGEDRIILSIRPGITGPASIKYNDEEYILSTKGNPQKYNDSVIWPDKVSINKKYAKTYNFVDDIKYIIETVVR